MLAYFQELMGGKTPEEIANQFDLDVASSSLYQTHLERVGLIQRKPRKQVELLVRPPVGFGPGSLYLKHEMQTFLTSIVTNVVHADDSQADCFAILKPLSLTEQDYRAISMESNGSSISIRQSARVELQPARHPSGKSRLPPDAGPNPSQLRLPRMTNEKASSGMDTGLSASAGLE